MIAIYFCDHELIYHTKDGPRTYNIKEDVPFGSMLYLLLSKTMYDRR